MTRTRFTQWVVLACIGTLAACTSGEGGPAGNTELNVIIPDGTGDPVDVQSVEYTIVCDGGEQGTGFLDDGATFDDAVTLNGNLEVVDGRGPGPGSTLTASEVWQGFMDLPPGQCLVQLRARDGDGEVICSGDNTVATDKNVTEGGLLKVDIVLVCDVSYQAPVGMLDLDGTFSFVVGNFCPNLFVLNCLDTNLFPTLPSPPGDPGPAVEGETTCEVRFNDEDGGCNEGCDPQVCVENSTTGLLDCTPASPPEDQNGVSMAGVNVRTTITCDSAGLDCDGLGGPDDTECVFDGDQLGSLPTNITTMSVLNAPFFGVNCGGAAPGATITCTAYTTDGDRDCDKTKTVSVVCPGLAPCDDVGAPDCTPTAPAQPHPECVTGVCDDSSGTAVCVFTPIAGNDGTAGSTTCGTNPGAPGTPGRCDSSQPAADLCVDFGCTFGDDSTCDNPATACLTNPAGACQTDGSCLAEIAGNEDGDCDSSTGGTGDTGTCASGTCVDNCTGVDCSDTGPNAECTQDVCTSGGGTFACSNPAVLDCTACCNAGAGAGSGDCTSGVCAAPPVLADVCQQFSPVPVNRVAACDPVNDPCICEKPEFLAIDCDLLGNSAALPIAASAQQFAPAVAGTPVGVFIQDAVVLPATLVCGFTTAAGFTDAEVLNSEALVQLSNASPASVLLSSFLHDQCGGSGCTTDADCALGEGVCDLTQPKPAPNTAPGTCLPTANCDPVTGSPIRSLHGATFFDFPLACGFGCVGGVCQADTSVSCTDFNDCLAFEGTGPGIVAPFLPNSPGAIPPGVLPSLVTPTASGTVNITTPYSGIEFNLAALTAPGTFIPAACVGGACPGGGICAPITRGTTVGPRVMYDAICNKIQFAGGACTPFEFYADTNDVCIGRFDGTFQEAIDLPCCDIGTFGGPDFDPDCVSAANVASCCTALASDWPDATATQQPELPVNP